DEPSEAPDPRQRPRGQPCHRAGFLPRGCQRTIPCLFPDSKSGGSFRGRSEGFFEAEACELRGWGWGFFWQAQGHGARAGGSGSDHGGVRCGLFLVGKG
ncbi:unnamed protein product, partial [Ectocarpus sp. 8 AP-2014]